MINPDLREYLIKLFPKIMKSLPGCDIIEYNIQIDRLYTYGDDNTSKK